MKPRLPRIALLLAAVLGAGIWWYITSAQQDSGELTLHGNVDIRQVDVAFRVGGRLAEVLVDEGGEVKEGDVLARLDADILTAARDAARAALAGNEAQLSRLKKGYRDEEIARAAAELAAARTNLAAADAELRRVSRLREKNAVSPKDMDKARAEQAQALGRMKSAAEQTAMLQSGYREEDIAAQAAQTDAARADLERADIQLNDAVLRAPQAGTVLTRAREAGSIVQAGQTVFTLSLTDPVWLRVYVEEPDLGRVKPGMPVRVAVDSAPDRTFPGVVGFVSPAAEFAPKSVETSDMRASLVYRVRVRMEDPENIMRQGMPVRVILPQDQG